MTRVGSQRHSKKFMLENYALTYAKRNFFITNLMHKLLVYLHTIH